MIELSPSQPALIFFHSELTKYTTEQKRQPNQREFKWKLCYQGTVSADEENLGCDLSQCPCSLNAPPSPSFHPSLHPSFPVELRLCPALVTLLKEAAFDSSWVQDDSVLYVDTTVRLLPPTRHRLTNNLLYKLKVPPMNLSKWAGDIWAHGCFKAMPEEPDRGMTQHARLS